MKKMKKMKNIFTKEEAEKFIEENNISVYSKNGTRYTTSEIISKWKNNEIIKMDLLEKAELDYNNSKEEYNICPACKHVKFGLFPYYADEYIRLLKEKIKELEEK